MHSSKDEHHGGSKLPEADGRMKWVFVSYSFLFLFLQPPKEYRVFSLTSSTASTLRINNKSATSATVTLDLLPFHDAQNLFHTVFVQDHLLLTCEVGIDVWVPAFGRFLHDPY